MSAQRELNKRSEAPMNYPVIGNQHSTPAAAPPRFSLAMVTPKRCLLLLSIILFINQPKSAAADEEVNLLQGINKYRASLYLTVLSENDNAACFAQELADQFKDLPCTNSTGPNTVPGTEDQLSNYPDLLSHCHLNISNTRDGAIMPACVPNLVPGLVLANFTESQYTLYLNDSKYTAAGVGSDGNWIVVVLSTNSSTGSFEAYNLASFISKPGLLFHLLFFSVCLFSLL
ncbi:hypothetical protein Dimus_029123 [Dionaea muscipula]